MAYRPEPAPFEEELAGLDALEVKTPRARSRARRIWSSLWPKFAAVGIVLLVVRAAIGIGRAAGLVVWQRSAVVH